MEDTEAPPASGPAPPPSLRTRIGLELPNDLLSDLDSYAERIGVNRTACVVMILRQRLGMPGGTQLQLPEDPPTPRARRARKAPAA